MKKTDGSRVAKVGDEIDRHNAAVIEQQERESIVAMNEENARTVEAHAKLALAMAPAELPAGAAPCLELSAGPAPGTARPLTIQEQDEIRAAEAGVLLAHFGDKAGKHGPLAAVRVPMTLRLSRETALHLNQLAGDLGTRPATLMTQLAVVIAKIAPEKYYAAVAGLAKHYGA
jgi:hypothetical protein